MNTNKTESRESHFSSRCHNQHLDKSRSLRIRITTNRWSLGKWVNKETSTRDRSRTRAWLKVRRTLSPFRFQMTNQAWRTSISWIPQCQRITLILHHRRISMARLTQSIRRSASTIKYRTSRNKMTRRRMKPRKGNLSGSGRTKMILVVPIHKLRMIIANRSHMIRIRSLRILNCRMLVERKLQKTNLTRSSCQFQPCKDRERVLVKSMKSKLSTNRKTLRSAFQWPKVLLKASSRKVYPMRHLSSFLKLRSLPSNSNESHRTSSHRSISSNQSLPSINWRETITQVSTPSFSRMQSLSALLWTNSI